MVEINMPNRMGVIVKTIQEFLDAFVNESVMRNVVGPIGKLRFRRQLAVQNQVCGFQIGAFFRQRFDGISRGKRRIPLSPSI